MNALGWESTDARTRNYLERSDEECTTTSRSGGSTVQVEVARDDSGDAASSIDVAAEGSAVCDDAIAQSFQCLPENAVHHDDTSMLDTGYRAGNRGDGRRPSG